MNRKRAPQPDTSEYIARLATGQEGQVVVLPDKAYARRLLRALVTVLGRSGISRRYGINPGTVMHLLAGRRDFSKGDLARLGWVMARPSLHAMSTKELAWRLDHRS